MKTSEEIIKNYDELYDITKGYIFHITPFYNTDSILDSGIIDNNNVKSYMSPWVNYKNVYFRDKGCVSLFDYRSHECEEFEFYSLKCGLSYFIKNKDYSASIFILNRSEYKNLITWQDVKEADDWIGTQIVPYIEVGYRSHVDLSVIVEHIIVRMDESFVEKELARHRI